MVTSKTPDRHRFDLEHGDALQYAHNKLAEDVNKGADDAGGKGIIYNVLTISDGISMGTEGMKYSLVSREVIADSVETVSGCMGHDGIITIGGCDKNMPGLLMGMARLNRPSIFIYGGTIQPGPNHTNIISVFEAVGGHAAGTVSDIKLKNIEETLSPAPAPAGACTPPTPWPQPLKPWV